MFTLLIIVVIFIKMNKLLPLKILTFVTTLFVASIFGAKLAFAGVDVSLSPATGVATNDFSVNLVVNTGGAGLAGITLTLTYTGPMNFNSAQPGGIGCIPTATETTHGTVNISCLLPSGTFTGTGTVSQITFHPTAVGAAVITLSNVDAGSLTVDSSTGGSYTMNPQSTGGLPHTALPQSILAISVGLLLLMIGGTYFAKKINIKRMFDSRKDFEKSFDGIFPSD